MKKNSNRSHITKENNLRVWASISGTRAKQKKEKKERAASFFNLLKSSKENEEDK